MGLNVLAGPLNFLYQNRAQSVAHCRKLLGLEDANPTGGAAPAVSSVARPRTATSPIRAGPKPPPVSGAAADGSLLDADDNIDLVDLSWLSSGDITTAPPYNPASPDQVHVYGQHVWVPTVQKWCELDTGAFEAPPAPAEHHRDLVYKKLVWHAKAGAWLKLKH